MSNLQNDGGPAFPRAPFEVNDYTGDGSPGMSLLDYFAAKAMQGMIAKSVHDETFGDFHEGTAQVYSQKAYIMAYAMLAERKNGGAS